MQKTLNNGVQMPLLGLGCWDMYGAEAQKAVETALEIGYRLIDTATLYRNEAEVGAAIRAAGLPRRDIFVTTKVANTEQGYDSTLRAYEKSLSLMGLDYVDLYLVHWPIPGKRRDTWLALERLYAEKAVRAIGVANYLPPFLGELDTYAEINPAVNQCEFSPFLFLKDLMAACEQRGILLQAWSPLVRGKKFQDTRLQVLAKKYERSPAQILLRWCLELGLSTIPKSSSEARLRENFGALDFQLAPEDMSAMNTWNENLLVEPADNPMKYWL